MYFQIEKVILWSRKKEFGYKTIDFDLGKVNVITGASRTGKSAIIPIIDYCLGAGSCSIPVKVIRNACNWFGVLVKLDGSQMLLARKEPEGKVTSNDMMFIRGKNIKIPDRPEKNSTRENVILELDEAAKLTFLRMNEQNESGFDARPAFRDMLKLCFQPQNIVANANTLFYKADTMEHRQKLISIFPYILGAVDANILSKRSELHNLQKELKKKERELEKLRAVSEKWDYAIRSWLNVAKEMGLIAPKVSIATLKYSTCVEILSQIAKEDFNSYGITSEGIEDALVELKELKHKERKLSLELSKNTRRKSEMMQFSTNIEEYRITLAVQRERLNIATWLKELSQENGICPFCGANHVEDEKLNELLENLEEVEREASGVSEIPIAFEREYSFVEGQISLLTKEIRAVQESIRMLDLKCRKNREQAYTLNEIEKFIGKVQYAEETFRSIGTDGELENEIQKMKERIKVLQIEVNEGAIRKRLEVALKRLERMIMYGLTTLDLEDADDPVEFDYKNLTVRVLDRNGRKNYLWEIGSGSNWLSYHMAVSLGIHRFAYGEEYSPIPQFLVYDQPSQVYFPQKLSMKEEEKELDAKLEDEDIEAVRKLFVTMDNAIEKCEGNLQIIVLEHADEEVWDGLENVKKVCEWRGENNALIPKEWIVE